MPGEPCLPTIARLIASLLAILVDPAYYRMYVCLYTHLPICLSVGLITGSPASQPVSLFAHLRKVKKLPVLFHLLEHPSACLAANWIFSFTSHTPVCLHTNPADRTLSVCLSVHPLVSGLFASLKPTRSPYAFLSFRPHARLSSTL